MSLIHVSTLLISAAAVVLAACGGDADPNAGKGPKITDPALVPTATPLVAEIIYHIQGDVVNITGGPSTTIATGSPTPASSSTYSIQPGDTCADIASKYKITVDALLKANRTITADCTNIRAGETLRIPAPAATTSTGPTPRPGGKEHTARPGDTCAGIAASFTVDVNQLIALNGLNADCTNLAVGQVVRIP
ncbi:MAG: LysM peptidoglycan-binding domain-containing protein [Dehalococcoidia bacterium]